MLAKQFQGRIVPGGANRADVNAAAAAIAMRRASMYGRGPIAEDLEVAYLLIGALEDVPGDWAGVGAQVARRISGLRFSNAASRAVELANSVPNDWIEPKPAAVRERLGSVGPAGTLGE